MTEREARGSGVNIAEAPLKNNKIILEGNVMWFLHRRTPQPPFWRESDQLSR
jgi:hypothetical protein